MNLNGGQALIALLEDGSWALTMKAWPGLGCNLELFEYCASIDDAVSRYVALRGPLLCMKCQVDGALPERMTAATYAFLMEAD